MDKCLILQGPPQKPGTIEGSLRSTKITSATALITNKTSYEIGFSPGSLVLENKLPQNSLLREK